MYEKKDELWMLQALKLAKQASDIDEIPVGALIVKDEKLIGQGYNQPILTHDPTAHAELIAIRNAATNQKNYRLLNSTMYVTLEPCCMCVGALIHARIKRLVFAAHDFKTGAVESSIRLISADFHNHKIEVLGGLLEDQASELLSSFFKQLRTRKSLK